MVQTWSVSTHTRPQDWRFMWFTARCGHLLVPEPVSVSVEQSKKQLIQLSSSKPSNPSPRPGLVTPPVHCSDHHEPWTMAEPSLLGRAPAELNHPLQPAEGRGGGENLLDLHVLLLPSLLPQHWLYSWSQERSASTHAVILYILTYTYTHIST